MSVRITIRGVPDDVRDDLAARAAQQRQSMQEFLRGELERIASRPSVEAWLRGVRARKEARARPEHGPDVTTVVAALRGEAGKVLEPAERSRGRTMPKGVATDTESSSMSFPKETQRNMHRAFSEHTCAFHRTARREKNHPSVAGEAVEPA